MPKDFPQNFLWGAATSAHQVEGNNRNNDWWEWEQAHKNLESSGEACDHYTLFREDFDLAKSLGHNAHRLSLEWSRIEPEEGKFSEREINHYITVLKALREQNFQVALTLHHFTLPLWFSQKGGFLNHKSRYYFTRFVETVVKKFSDYVDLWITINEPNVYAGFGYLQGKWPPGEKNFHKFKRALKNLVKSHKKAYAKIHALLPEARVGIAKNFVYFEPAKSFFDKIACRLADKFWNHLFYKKTKGYHDFLGVNYYYRDFIRTKLHRPFYQTENESQNISDLGWEIYPEGLYQILLKLKKYNLPIYVTENGIADKQDSLRPQFITQHIEAISRALAQNVPVHGYFHWSLLDNFEWAHGFTPRFGLVDIDYKTQKRTPRESAYRYKKIIEKFLIQNS